MQPNSILFPCQFPIKIIGNQTPDFTKTVLRLLQQHWPALSQADLRATESTHKNYLSITVSVKATSQQQLDAIYQTLSSHPDIVMVL